MGAVSNVAKAAEPFEFEVLGPLTAEDMARLTAEDWEAVGGRATLKDAKVVSFEERKRRLATEFGPNGGTLRKRSEPEVSLNSGKRGRLVGDEKAFLDQLLKTHSYVEIGAKVRIAHWERPPGGNEQLQLLAPGDFAAYYANRSLTLEKPDGKTESVPVAVVFARQAERYRGVVLAPDQPTVVDRHLNLWRGFSVKAEPGEWGLMRQHIVEVLAGGNAEYAEYILRWAAWTLQNPGRPAEVALVFRGGKGSGKGTFGRAMKDLFGANGLQISNSRHLTGNFNKHLMYTCLLFADEAFWAGDRQGESELKRLITEPTLMIEQKGIDAFAVENRLHVIMASNDRWVVPASHDERRYAVFDCAPLRMGDATYFEALNAQLEAGGLAAMLHDLRGMDLRGWHPRKDVPETEALQEQKRASVRGVEAVIYDLAMEGALPCARPGQPNVALTTGDGGFWEHCRSAQPGLRQEAARSLMPKFREWGFIAWKCGNQRGLKAPLLSELRARLERKYGAEDWPEGDTWGA